MIFLFFIFISFPCIASEETSIRSVEIELPAIVKNGTPADVLQEDPILPVYEMRNPLGSSTGSIQKGIQNQIALPVGDTGRSGEFAQFKGLGRSAEDTVVETLGISLNSPQGGGTNLAIFPQYLWSSYRFQSGPSLGAFDPRGISGTLDLVPWTQQVLSQQGSGGRVMEVYSDQLMQFSAAGYSQNYGAAVVGYSRGDAEGPAGSLSLQKEIGNLSTKFHLLATRIDAASRGSVDFPTPLARMLTVRVIPIAQTDYKFSLSTLLKTSFFYDGTYLRYDNPDSSFSFAHTRDQIRQGGMESALLWNEWKFGLGVRQITYQQIGFEAPTETVFNFQGSRIWEKGPVLIEPTVGLVGATQLGAFPVGSLGIRKELELNSAIFSRLSFSRKFPSMVDRYYSIPEYYVANPNLRAERDWTFIIGEETKLEHVSASIQFYSQLRQDAQVQVPTFSTPPLRTMANLGTAQVRALMFQASTHLWPWLEVTNDMTLAESEVKATHQPFPYLPSVIDVFSVRIHPDSEKSPWSLQASSRFAQASFSPLRSDHHLPGYGYLDLSGKVHLFRKIDLLGQLDDVFDRPIELVEGYPLRRVLTLSLVCEL